MVMYVDDRSPQLQIRRRGEPREREKRRGETPGRGATRQARLPRSPGLLRMTNHLMSQLSRQSWRQSPRPGQQAISNLRETSRHLHRS